MPLPLRPALLALLLAVATCLAGAGPASAALPTPRPPVAPTTAPDAPSRYQGQVTCDPTEKPGAAALRELLRTTYGRANAGGTARACSIGGTSEHKEGRAYDWMLDVGDPVEKQMADSFVAWLTGPDATGVTGGNARRLGVQYVIWNRQTWQSWTGTWKAYTGAAPHTDHVHVSLSWDGALKRTSFWTGKAVTAVDHGPCQVYVGELVTPYSAPNYTPCPRPVPRPTGDLYAVVTGGASGTVEIHADSRSSTYAKRVLSTATGLPSKDPSQWRYFVAPVNGGDRPDLLAVQTQGTASGKVEVSVYSASSGYRSRSHLAVTPMAAFVPDARFQVDVAADAGGRPDLVFADLQGSGGTVDVHVASFASGWSRFSLQKSTALPNQPGSNAQVVMDDARDLWMIIHDGTTGSRGQELHVVTASSSYQTFSVHRALPAELGPRTKWTFATGDYDGDRRHDLYLLKVDGTGSGRTEVHVLTARSQFTTFALHRATTLPMLRYPQWQTSIG